jgi:hypothetical protein
MDQEHRDEAADHRQHVEEALEDDARQRATEPDARASSEERGTEDLPDVETGGPSSRRIRSPVAESAGYSGMSPSGRSRTRQRCARMRATPRSRPPPRPTHTRLVFGEDLGDLAPVRPLGREVRHANETAMPTIRRSALRSTILHGRGRRGIISRPVQGRSAGRNGLGSAARTSQAIAPTRIEAEARSRP